MWPLIAALLASSAQADPTFDADRVKRSIEALRAPLVSLQRPSPAAPKVVFDPKLILSGEVGVEPELNASSRRSSLRMGNRGRRPDES